MQRAVRVGGAGVGARAALWTVVLAACGSAQFERAPGATKVAALPGSTPILVVGTTDELPQPVEVMGLLKLDRTKEPVSRADAEPTLVASAARYGCDAIVAPEELRDESKSPVKRKTMGAGGAPVYVDDVEVRVEYQWVATCARSARAAILAAEPPRPPSESARKEAAPPPEPRPEVVGKAVVGPRPETAAERARREAEADAARAREAARIAMQIAAEKEEAARKAGDTAERERKKLEAEATEKERKRQAAEAELRDKQKAAQEAGDKAKAAAAAAEKARIAADYAEKERKRLALDAADKARAAAESSDKGKANAAADAAQKARAATDQAETARLAYENADKERKRWETEAGDKQKVYSALLDKEQKRQAAEKAEVQKHLDAMDKEKQQKAEAAERERQEREKLEQLRAERAAADAAERERKEAAEKSAKAARAAAESAKAAESADADRKAREEAARKEAAANTANADRASLQAALDKAVADGSAQGWLDFMGQFGDTQEAAAAYDALQRAVANRAADWVQMDPPVVSPSETEKGPPIDQAILVKETADAGAATWKLLAPRDYTVRLTLRNPTKHAVQVEVAGGGVKAARLLGPGAQWSTTQTEPCNPHGPAQRKVKQGTTLEYHFDCGFDPGVKVMAVRPVRRELAVDKRAVEPDVPFEVIAKVWQAVPASVLTEYYLGVIGDVVRRRAEDTSAVQARLAVGKKDTQDGPTPVQASLRNTTGRDLVVVFDLGMGRDERLLVPRLQTGEFKLELPHPTVPDLRVKGLLPKLRSPDWLVGVWTFQDARLVVLPGDKPGLLLAFAIVGQPGVAGSLRAIAVPLVVKGNGAIEGSADLPPAFLRGLFGDRLPTGCDAGCKVSFGGNLSAMDQYILGAGRVMPLDLSAGDRRGSFKFAAEY